MQLFNPFFQNFHCQNVIIQKVTCIIKIIAQRNAKFLCMKLSTIKSNNYSAGAHYFALSQQVNYECACKNGPK